MRKKYNVMPSDILSSLIKYSLLTAPPGASNVKRRLDVYRLSLITKTFSKTRFSQIDVRTDEIDREVYTCSDPNHILGTLMIYEDPRTNHFILLRDDSFYNYVDIDLIEKVGMTIDEFCTTAYKSLEDLVNNASKILLCLKFD